MRFEIYLREITLAMESVSGTFLGLPLPLVINLKPNLSITPSTQLSFPKGLLLFTAYPAWHEPKTKPGGFASVCPTLLALLNDFRTFDWADEYKYPTVVLDQMKGLLTKYENL